MAMTQNDETGRQVVVGIDGSPPSLAALEWAAQQADMTGATLQVVAVTGVAGMGKDAFVHGVRRLGRDAGRRCAGGTGVRASRRAALRIAGGGPAATSGAGKRA